MKRFALQLSISLLTFACVVVLASLLNWNKTNLLEPSKIHSSQPNLLKETAAPAPTITPEPPREVVFSGDGLGYVTDEVHLKSERLRYQIDVNYPRIIGKENRQVRELNRRVKELVTKEYQWLLKPSEQDLRYYRKKWPEVFNSVEINYEISLAEDSRFSVRFIAYSYGIGAAHSVQQSFVVNYDLQSGQDLKLVDFFRPGTKYLRLISEYCKQELSKGKPYGFISERRLAPKQENYESWNITAEGIRFNFDACSVFACADGEQQVLIPFSVLNQWSS